MEIQILSSYFIIIDDLWSTSVWDIIRRAFPDGGRSSRIITTTQFKDVASACCSYQSNYIFQMVPLKDDQSRRLFFSMVFGSEDKVSFPEDSEGVSSEIIQKCGGLPLSIINIASLLPTPSKPNIQQWLENIRDSLPSTLRTNPTSEGIKDVLNLIYNSLSPQLKTCLLYLVVYPEGRTIIKDDLVKQWVIEGIIGEGQNREDIAGGYFDELVSRGMIQVVDSYHGVLSCTLHHMVHDLIVKKSIEENFIIIVDYFQSAIGLPDKVHRLSVQFGGARSARIPAGIMLSEVRSLAFFGFCGCGDFIEECKLLRVLILHVWADKDEAPFDLSGISKLLPLRYLKIACNIAIKLPDKIQDLQYLETLEVDATVVAIPSDIGGLRRLSSLKIAVRVLSRQDICILQALPALSALSLHVWTTPVEMIVFDKAEFLVLKYFKFRCPVPWLKFEVGSMPDLRNLNLYFNAHEADQHGIVPIGMEHLLSLKEITANIWGADTDVGSTFRTAISNHPSNPRIDVQMVDRIFHVDATTSMGTKAKENMSEDEDKAEDEKKQAADSSMSTVPRSKRMSTEPRNRADHGNKEPTYLPFALLQQITDNFSEEKKIGQGGFGKVYKGVYNGEEIAVKLFYDVPALDNKQFQFENEIANLQRIKHPNIVRLLGYCYVTQHKPVEYSGELRFAQYISRILCFEYLQGGSLDKYLNESPDHDWPTRYNIIEGTCEGLNFLHGGCGSQILHLNLKPTNILLDKYMGAKVADFGLSRFFSKTHTHITNTPTGTEDYMPPEFRFENQISPKNDVYSLGIIIIEIMAGRVGYSKFREMDDVKPFVEQVVTNWREWINATTSPFPAAELDQVKTCIKIAIKCVDPERKNRPTVAQILDTLQETEKRFLEEWRNHAGFFVGQSLPTPTKIEPWGGCGGEVVDIKEDPWRLHSLTISYQGLIDSFSFSYIDQSGKKQRVGPWGEECSYHKTETIRFGPSEFIEEVSGAYGSHFENILVTSLTFVTNIRTYGPFGNSHHQHVAATPFRFMADVGSSIVGFHGRSGSHLFSIGVYMSLPTPTKSGTRGGIGGKVVDEVNSMVVYEPMKPQENCKSREETNMPAEEVPEAKRRKIIESASGKGKLGSSKKVEAASMDINLRPPQSFSRHYPTNKTYLGEESQAVDVARGAMGSLLDKLGKLVKEDYNLERSMKRDIESFSEDLAQIHKDLPKLEKLDGVKIWVDEVRELSYNIEDMVDSFLVHVEPDSSRSGFRELTHEGLKLLENDTMTHCEIGDVIRDIKNQVQAVLDRQKKYNFSVNKVVADPTAKAPIDPRMAIYIHKIELVGIEARTDELIRLFEEDGDVSKQELKIVSIVGLGGLGKTTLARAVYDKLKAQYHSRAFVTVGRNPDVKKVLMNILSALGNKFNDLEVWQLIDELQKLLEDKRYFIVIDDIWDSNAWGPIQSAFPENSLGSRVMTTTRIHRVAFATCNAGSKHVYQMKPLRVEESRRLFFRRIFGPEKDCPDTPRKEEISTYILKKCGGMPLAINIIASLLVGEEESTWEYIWKSLGSVTKGDDLEKMKQILDLSYIHLPDYLKTCLLYVCMYPEDWDIDKNELLRKWVAEGFVHVSRNSRLDAEDVAEKYFKELISMCMIQPGRIDDYSNEVLSCRVHDIILDLMRSKSSKENFIHVIDGSKDESGEIRRVSIHYNDKEDTRILETINKGSLSHVRSVLFCRSSLVPYFLEFKYVRVLHIELKYYSWNNHLDLTSISRLFLLRYLKVASGLGMELKLPNQIGELQQLETVDIDGVKLTNYPSDIVSLPWLSYLRFGSVLPDRIDRLKSLRTLEGVDVFKSSVENIKGLNKLINLRKLQISSNGSSESVEETTMDALYSSISKLSTNLRILTFKGAVVYIPDVPGWITRTPFPQGSQIRELDLGGCRFERCPEWIGQLHGLYKFCISVRGEVADGISIVARLPSLAYFYLGICVMGEEEEKEESVVIPGIGSGAFRALKHLIFYCEKASLTFEAGAMPKLEKLEILFRYHTTPKFIPAGIQYLPASTLKQIILHVALEGDQGWDPSTQHRTYVRHLLEGAFKPHHPAAEIIVDF